jgi:hypothetical protein
MHNPILKMVEFVNDKNSYKILRGSWYRDPTEDKTDDVKDSSYEELERVFDKFHEYHMKIC